MKKINNFLFFYLLILLIFAYFFLFIKHQVGNDSTMSEWFINYEGGFTRRGFAGQLAVELTRLFQSNLRWVIFLLQSFICTIYFFLLYQLLKNLKYERIIVLSILTPIFILYPIAEIEVLARKEIIIFSFFLIYLLVPRSNNFKIFLLLIFSILSIIIWEPIIFFFPLIFIYEVIDNNITKINFNFFKIFLIFIPSLIIALIIILYPLTEQQHSLMSYILLSEFGQTCYMSCELLKTKSSIMQQFQGNYYSYSLQVFIRYFLIILIGFFPLFTLIKNSYLSNKNSLMLKFSQKPSTFFYICLSPVIILFAMGYDWGRWVNITYVILALIYFKLLINNHFKLNFKKLRTSFFYRIKERMFIFFFVIYCFGWYPKTVMTSDVGSFPEYRIPYKIFKILSN